MAASGRAHRGGFEESFGLDDNDRKAKPGLMRRWFSGAEPAAAPTEPPPAARPWRARPGRRPRRRRSGGSAAPAPKPSWLQRLRAGLSRSSTTIARGVADIFTKRKLDATSLDDLEDVLIQADLGLAAASRIREAVGARALRARNQPGGSQADPGRRGRPRARAGRPPAHDRSDEAPVRDPGRRRQRLGQDDDHRQARRQVPGRREVGPARRGRHVPRRRDRAVAHLGAGAPFPPSSSASRARTRPASPSTLSRKPASSMSTSC